MPKGFTSTGQTILTKDEFLDAFFTARGYEKNIGGEWELIYPELNTPKEKTTEVTKTTRKTATTTKKVAAATKSDAPKPSKTASGLTKESVIENIDQFLSDNEYKYTADKATFLVALGNENYEFKITKKSSAFEFESEFDSVKDFGKQKFIKLLTALDFCEVGVIDTKGTIGFTDNKEYITITITKKRK